MSTNTYRALNEAAEAAFTVGPFDHEFTVEEERDWVSRGALEIVPRTYRSLTDTKVFGVSSLDDPPTFEAALLIEQEAALLGSHIERVDPEPVRAKAGKSAPASAAETSTEDKE